MYLHAKSHARFLVFSLLLICLYLLSANVSFAGTVPTALLRETIAGTQHTLKWSTTDALSCIGTNFDVSDETHGTIVVSQDSPKTYWITCKGSEGMVTTSNMDDGTVANPAPSLIFTALKSSIKKGDSTKIAWSSAHGWFSSNATSCTASGGWTGAKSLTGIETITPSQTTNYKLTCSGPGGSVEYTLPIEVTDSDPTPPVSPPVTVTLNLGTGAIRNSGDVELILSWSANNATACTGTNFNTENKTSGALFTYLTTPTKYTVECVGASGKASRSATYSGPFAKTTGIGASPTTPAVTTPKTTPTVAPVVVTPKPATVAPKVAPKTTPVVTPTTNTAPPAVGEPVTSSAPLILSRDLYIGVSGTDVAALQETLISEGLLDAGNNTGYFGNLTKAAVMKFQQANSVRTTGYVGQLTRGVLGQPR